LELIGDGAFGNCGFEFIVIPDSVATIEIGSFLGCSLVNVTLGANITSIGERAFFGCASTEGTAATLKATDIEKKVEELIQLVEGTKNDFVDGVERDMINVVCSPAVYGELRTYLDKSANANVNTGAGECGTYHGVKVFSSVYLADGDDMVAIVDGAIAQPVTTTLDEADKYPASNCYHFGMFYSYGTKAVAPDLIQVVKA
jgi:hypothetical protein